MNEDIKKFIDENLYKDNKAIAKRFTENWFSKNGYQSQWNEINELTKEFLPDTTFGNRIFFIKQDILEPGKCKVCGAKTKVDFSSGHMFRLYCCKEHQFSDPDIGKMMSEGKKKTDHVKANAKRAATMKEKYGHEFNTQRPEIKKSLSKFTTERYLNKDQIEKLEDPIWLKEMHYDKQYTIKALADLLKVDTTTIYSRFSKFNIEPKQYIKNSFGERELANELQNLNIRIETNKIDLIPNRRLEFDIYLPDYNIAIEYNGELYHSEKFKANDFHYNKWKLAKENNIQLISIFEIEWQNNKDKILSFIKSKLNVNDKIYARNCKFKQIDKHESSEFMKKYHMQGTSNLIDECFGLYHENVLVASVMYGRHHRDNKTKVLKRMAFKNDISIIGGAEKLLKNSLEILNENIITWSDNRFSNGDIYEKCGFTKDAELREDYFYTNFHENTSKQSMKEFYRKIDDRTGHQRCNDMGWFRIYDCGKTRWKYIVTEDVSENDNLEGIIEEAEHNPFIIPKSKSDKTRFEKLQKQWKLTNPVGQEFFVTGLKNICKENNLDTGNMSKVASGKLKTYKGWKCEKLN